MNKWIWGVLLVGFPLFFTSPAVAADAMKPGLWEITTSVEMPGMPFQAPPQTMRHCYTAQEVKEQPVPKDEQCKVTDLKSSGSKVTWKVECKGEMAGKGEGEIIYQGDSAYEGKTRMQTQGMTMAMKYKAKRLGECK
ncbi:MAG: DUF3617 domain-containing protein [Desulfuromonadales bacterium]|nr:DUF3617 domain-containing protein [Desulfuromonadales bacterium]